MTNHLHHQTIIYLITTLKNNIHLSPLTSTYKLKIFKILSKYLIIKNITFFKKKNNILINITNIIPISSINLSTKYFTNNSSNKIKTKLSILKILLHNINKKKTSQILNIPPIKKIKKIYNIINTITFTILILLHITYIKLFNYTKIKLSKKFHHNPINITTNSSLYILTYIIIPIKPLIFLLYFIISIINLIKHQNFTNPILQFLPFLFYLIFSNLIIT